jgi:hypothetical protein
MREGRATKSGAGIMTEEFFSWRIAPYKTLRTAPAASKLVTSGLITPIDEPAWIRLQSRRLSRAAEEETTLEITIHRLARFRTRHVFIFFFA